MHKDYMLAALEQAWLGQGSCAPNPSVGAVAVHKGEIIARAWHQGAGKPHAEQLILQKIPSGLSEVTLYVTLEPCNHWGKTPPCVAGIVQYGIAEVFYGYNDPNPLVAANNTPHLLQKEGIKTSHFPLAEINDFYTSYSYWTLQKKPFVSAKIAQSLDAKIAGKNGKRCQLSNLKCEEFTHLKRLHSDIILTTAKTIHNDNPRFDVRLPGKEQGKNLAIIDRTLSLKKSASIFETSKHAYIFHDEAYPVENPIPNCSYFAIPAKEGLLDLSAIINRIGALGFHDLWVEAGGILFSALHREKLVQRSYIYLVPTTLGTSATSAYPAEDIFGKKPRVSWQIQENNVIACLDWLEE